MRWVWEKEEIWSFCTIGICCVMFVEYASCWLFVVDSLFKFEWCYTEKSLGLWYFEMRHCYIENSVQIHGSGCGQF